MDQVSIFLLTIAGIFLVGVIGEWIFERTHLPDAVWLVGIGIVLGPVTGLLRADWLRPIAPFFAALTLIVILFDGGRRFRLDSLGRSALPALGLAGATFVLSCVAVAVLAQLAAAAGWIPAPWSLRHSVLLGTILGGSSSVVILPSMAKARVAPRIADLVSLESALTDVLCVVGAATVAQMIEPVAGTRSVLESFERTIGLGFGIGLGAGALWMLFTSLLHDSAHSFPLTLAALLVLYVGTQSVGGSAALAVLAFAVLVGNSEWIKTRLRLATRPAPPTGTGDFHDQLVFMVKSFFFTFIGAMLSPPWGLAIFGLLLGLALYPARLPGAWGIAAVLRLPAPERGIIAASLPRGLAAGVLAILPWSQGVPGTESLPAIVFPAVVVTIVIFAVRFRHARSRIAPAGPPAPAGPQEAAADGTPAAPAD